MYVYIWSARMPMFNKEARFQTTSWMNDYEFKMFSEITTLSISEIIKNNKI